MLLTIGGQGWCKEGRDRIKVGTFIVRHTIIIFEMAVCKTIVVKFTEYMKHQVCQQTTSSV